MKTLQRVASIAGMLCFILLALQGFLSLINDNPIAFAANTAQQNRAISSTAVPDYINYQGTQLIDGDGNLIDGMFDMTFRVYESVDGTSATYTQQVAGVQVRSGTFSVLLGGEDGQPALSDVLNDRDRFIGITVDNNPEMTPRQRFVSVAYAFTADSLGRSVTTDANGNVLIGDAPAYTTGAFTIATGDDVQVTNGMRSSIGALVISDPDSSTGKLNLHIDSNEIQALDELQPHNLSINPGGGNVYIGDASTNRFSIQGTNTIITGGRLQLNNSHHDGLQVTDSHLSGVAVFDSGTHGLYVRNASEYGIWVDSSSDDAGRFDGDVSVNGKIVIDDISWSINSSDYSEYSRAFASNGGGEDQEIEELGPTSTHFCALGEVHFHGIQDGQNATCEVYPSGGYWYLKADTSYGASRCQAVCLKFD